MLGIILFTMSNSEGHFLEVELSVKKKSKNQELFLFV